jgi:putative transposase
MMDADPEELSLVCQGELWGVSRSAGYSPPRPWDPQDLELRRLIDEPYLRTPFYGSRKRREHLRRLG